MTSSRARLSFAYYPRPTEIHLVRHHTHSHGLTKDDGLLGGGTVRVDKVDGGVDRGVGRLGKDAIHLIFLLLSLKNK